MIKMFDVNFSANLIECSEEDKKVDTLPLKIRGKAVNSGFIKSKNFYLPEDELNNIVNSLKTGIDGSGAYLLKNHGSPSLMGTDKNTDSLIGKVVDAKKSGINVNYVARVEDADMANKIRKDLVSSSSIGLSVETAYCSVCGKEYGNPECNHRLGVLYPDEGLASVYQQLADELGGSRAVIVGQNIGAKELSIVLFPAIEGASALPMSFDEKTESLILETETRKIDILNRKDNIVADLQNVGNKIINLDDVKIFAKDNDLIILTKEQYKELKDTLEYMEVSLWARDVGLENERENLSQYIGLTKEQRELIIELSHRFAETKSRGKAAIDNINLVDEETKKKEDFRELIFHTRRDIKK